MFHLLIDLHMSHFIPCTKKTPLPVDLLNSITVSSVLLPKAAAEAIILVASSMVAPTLDP